jgi:hypothetical protein
LPWFLAAGHEPTGISLLDSCWTCFSCERARAHQLDCSRAYAAVHEPVAFQQRIGGCHLQPRCTAETQLIFSWFSKCVLTGG